jgi:hypothetical protein
MAIEYNQTTAQTVQFGAITGGATIRNMRLLVVPTTPTSFNETFYMAGAAELTGLILNEGAGVFDAGKFAFNVFFSGTNGLWYTTSDVLTLNVVNEIFITYDGSSTTNDPLFYVNGASVSVSELTTPTGTIDTSATIVPLVGAVTGKSPAGKILAVNYITGRVVGAAEVADAYNSRLAIPSYRGLVFAPALWGAAGGVKNGDTLATANEITDIVSGARGVPSGSPVLVEDTHLVLE